LDVRARWDLLDPDFDAATSMLATKCKDALSMFRVAFVNTAAKSPIWSDSEVFAFPVVAGFRACRAARPLEAIGQLYHMRQLGQVKAHYDSSSFRSLTPLKPRWHLPSRRTSCLLVTPNSSNINSSCCP
jgi:hypothetical protein